MENNMRNWRSVCCCRAMIVLASQRLGGMVCIMSVSMEEYRLIRKDRKDKDEELLSM